MDVNPVGLGQPRQGTGQAEQSLAGTFDTFLQLLTTQLRNQDPLDPLDSTQFTEQLVQYSGVEQAINTNKKLDQLIGVVSGGQLNGAVSFIGKTAEFVHDKVALEDGSAAITYTLERNAAEARLSIGDAAGRLVRTVPLDATAGAHEFVWDGRDGNGQPVPDGTYNLLITAVDQNGDTIAAATYVSGRVTGIEQSENGVTLNVGDLDVALDSVRAVREPDEA